MVATAPRPRVAVGVTSALVVVVVVVEDIKEEDAIKLRRENMIDNIKEGGGGLCRRREVPVSAATKQYQQGCLTNQMPHEILWVPPKIQTNDIGGRVYRRKCDQQAKTLTSLGCAHDDASIVPIFRQKVVACYSNC